MKDPRRIPLVIAVNPSDKHRRLNRLIYGRASRRRREELVFERALDGLAWADSHRETPRMSAQRWVSICEVQELGLTCAISADGQIMTSSDGITWTMRTRPSE